MEIKLWTDEMFTKEMGKTLMAKAHDDMLTEIAYTASGVFSFSENYLFFNSID